MNVLIKMAVQNWHIESTDSSIKSFQPAQSRFSCEKYLYALPYLATF